ncbi:MAG: methyltransferase domain-containing protein [Candidatus Krumholzibacteriia bacterium]
MPAWAFVRNVFLEPRSPACAWRHPLQAARVAAGATGNVLVSGIERVRPGGPRECPVCGWRGRRFRAFLSADEVIGDSICPECGSFDRHRLLVTGVRGELGACPGRGPEVMLGFSLSSAMRYLLEHEGLRRCYRTDAQLSDRRFCPDLITDLRCACVRTAGVDWLFCSHVLEHIEELEPAVDELARMLRPGGLAWIQVPLHPGLERSRRIPVDPHRAHAHAWQFGLDFGEFLARADWTVREVTAAAAVPPDLQRRHGIAAEERYWMCRKGDRA